MSTEKDRADVSENLRRWRKLDDRKDVQRRVMRALKTCEELMYHPGTDDAERRRCATTISQLARTYLNCLEVGEYEERISRLEELQSDPSTNGHSVL